MIAAFSALLPVLLITVIGYTIRRTGLVPDDQWPGFETIAYHVLFPAIIIVTLVDADFRELPFFSMAGTLFCCVLTMTAVCFALRPLFKRHFGIGDEKFTSILQGSIRWNTFIALAMAANLYGENGLALSAVAIVALQPIVNIINVTTLAVLVAPDPPTLSRVILQIVRNPFIWSGAIGLLLNLTGLGLAEPVEETLRMLGRSALAAGVLSVGAGLDLSSLRRPGPALGTSTVLGLIGMPTLAALYAGLFGLTGEALGVAIVATAVPSASGAYILARRMGGDAKLMAEILTLQTILAAATLPLAIAIYS